MRKETAEKILSETKHGYDMVSKKFSQTRKHFWREMEFIRDFCAPGDKVLDFGCGNGRLLNLLEDKNVEYHGVDVSRNLIEHAQDLYVSPLNSFKKINPGQISLPFASEFFNTVYSIAVFHHFPSIEHRRKMAEELFRVTTPGGTVVIDVWNLWQKKYFKNIFKNWKNKLKGESELDWNDCHISFMGEDGKKFHRFHHAFTTWELKRLFAEVGFKIEKCEVIGKWHIVLVAKK